jgi:linoleoyl-CoA desaturase
MIELDSPVAAERPALDAAGAERYAQIAAELDAIGDAVRADLGARDATYIHRVIAVQRALELCGRGLLAFPRRRGALAAGTVALTLSKVLSNMEIGHNVMHGQWDWMNDRAIHSSTWEWDAVSTARSWKYSHNFQHHQHTNVIGKDRDLGYSAMRVEPEQPWHPIYLLQPIYGALMALVFEWAIAVYDMELDAVRAGTKSREQARSEIRAFLTKSARQVVKDGVAYPALARRHWRRTLAANLAANVARNVWVHTIVFMGHIPDGAQTFTEAEVENETRGEWYVRQMVGSCNLDGSPLFHILSGNLSFQIEHHLFPDIPSNRYKEIAPAVRAVCARHGLAYNTGCLRHQYKSVARKIVRLSLPGG